MDDRDKNVVEQIVDSVNDLVESVANTASEALEPATHSPGPKPKRQSVPDYEFPAAASSANTVSTPVKKPAAKKKTQLAKNPVKNTVANSSSKQSENVKQLSKKRKSKR